MRIELSLLLVAGLLLAAVGFPSVATAAPTATPALSPSAPGAGLKWSVTAACLPPYYSQVCVPSIPYAAPNNIDPNMELCARNAGLSGVCQALYASDPATGTFYVWTNAGLGSGPIPSRTVGWEWQGGAWSNVTYGSKASVLGYTLYDSAGSPECMAWDPAEGGFIAVASNNTYPSNPGWTYLYSGGVWSNLTYVVPFEAPSTGGVGTCKMAWDPADAELVMVYSSGFSAPATPEWTWTFAGSGWTNISANSVTPNLYTSAAFAMAWDPSDSELVLEGATNGWATTAGLQLTTTYTFSGGAWTNRTPTWTNCATETSPCAPSTPEPPGNDGGQLLSTWGYGVVDIGGYNLSSGTSCYYSPYVWYWQHDQWSNLTAGGKWPLTGNCAGTGPLSVYVPGTKAYYASGNSYGLLAGPIGAGSILAFGGSGIVNMVDGEGTAMNATDWSLSFPPATGIGASSSGSTCNSVQVSWTNPTPPSGSSLLNDTLEVLSPTGAVVATVSTGGPAQSATATGLSCGSAYTCSIEAWFSGGVASPFSTGIACDTAASLGGLLSVLQSPAGLSVLAVLFALAVVALVVSSRRHKRGAPSRRVGGR